MNARTDRKMVLVTGAAKGIGRSLAIAIAQQGADVALHYYSSESEALKTAEEIKKLGVNVILVKGDIASIEEVQLMKTTIENDGGEIHSIVNNAGWTQYKSFFKYEPGEWTKEVEICLYGVLNLAYTFLPEMKARNEGKFINIIGDSARTGDRNLIISAAARNGAISFLKSLAQEVGRFNIQCNTVSLGLIEQEQDFDADTMKKILKQYPLKRLGNEEDIQGAVLFLLSSSSDWITGQVIPVNGGQSMMG